MKIEKDAVDLLENLQLHYLRLLLAVPVSCPKVALRFHTGTLALKYRIWIEKVMLVYHIRKLLESSLANMVYLEQVANKWPGLAGEVTAICEDLKIEQVHDTDDKKQQYKKLLVQACLEKDEEELKEKMGSKCSSIKEDKFQVQDYMKVNSLSDIREIFRIKTRMNKLRANFPSDPKCGAWWG